MRKLDVELCIDGRTYPITIYSVCDVNKGHDVVIGMPLFQTSAELRVGPESVEIIYVREIRQMMAIVVGALELEVDEKAYLPVIQKIISSYTPKSHAIVPIKTVIVLSDEISVYQRPRWLAPREKVAVEQQV